MSMCNKRRKKEYLCRCIVDAPIIAKSLVGVFILLIMWLFAIYITKVVCFCKWTEKARHAIYCAMISAYDRHGGRFDNVDMSHVHVDRDTATDIASPVQYTLLSPY